jgi:hypothetical protein
VIEEDHIEPTPLGGMTLLAASAAAVGLAVAIPVGIVLFAADAALWGLQFLGRHARRGTGRALVWIVGRGMRG